MVPMTTLEKKRSLFICKATVPSTSTRLPPHLLPRGQGAEKGEELSEISN